MSENRRTSNGQRRQSQQDDATKTGTKNSSEELKEPRDSRGNLVTAAHYLHAARVLETAKPHLCHPYAYERRFVYATNLREMAKRPHVIHHLRALNTILIFCLDKRLLDDPTLEESDL
jgi:hypothetical protein